MCWKKGDTPINSMEMRCILGRSVVLATFYFKSTQFASWSDGARFSAGINLHNFNIHTKQQTYNKNAVVAVDVVIFFCCFSLHLIIHVLVRCGLGLWDIVMLSKGDGTRRMSRMYMRGRLLFLIFLWAIFDGFIRISMFTFLESESAP